MGIEGTRDIRGSGIGERMRPKEKPSDKEEKAREGIGKVRESVIPDDRSCDGKSEIRKIRKV